MHSESTPILPIHKDRKRQNTRKHRFQAVELLDCMTRRGRECPIYSGQSYQWSMIDGGRQNGRWHRCKSVELIDCMTRRDREMVPSVQVNLTEERRSKERDRTVWRHVFVLISLIDRIAEIEIERLSSVSISISPTKNDWETETVIWKHLSKSISLTERITTRERERMSSVSTVIIPLNDVRKWETELLTASFLVSLTDRAYHWKGKGHNVLCFRVDWTRERQSTEGENVRSHCSN